MGQKLGQHFLHNPATVETIVSAADLGPSDTVVEVGPGRGALTDLLLSRSGSLHAVELDRKLAAALRERLAGNAAFKLVEGDFLRIPESALPSGPLKFVGNLPYESGTAILRRILHWPGWVSAVVMLQKEVAQRLVAAPGGKAYGLLTLETALRAELDWVCDVPPQDFSPPPRVDSAVVRLRPKVPPLLDADQERRFLRVARACFQQRRKTIHNSLSAAWPLPKPEAARLLEGSGIAPTARAETVPLDAFLRLCAALP